MQEQNRRQFNRATLSSLLTFSLLETLAAEDLFSAETKSVTGRWLTDLHDLGKDLKGEKLSPIQWQDHCEELFKKVDLEDLLKFIDFGGRISSVPFREKGERAIRFKFPEVEGLPTSLVFGHQVFKLKKGQSRIEAYADWMISPKNPRFTKTIVNRMWKKVFGVGLYEPVDKIDDSTKPPDDQLMAYLEKLMVDLEYDMRKFNAVLYKTDAFSRESQSFELNSGESFYFQGPRLQRMSAEQIWDSVVSMIRPEVDKFSDQNYYNPRLKAWQKLNEQSPDALIKKTKEVASFNKETQKKMDQFRQQVKEVISGKKESEALPLARRILNFNEKATSEYARLTFWDPSDFKGYFRTPFRNTPRALVAELKGAFPSKKYPNIYKQAANSNMKSQIGKAQKSGKKPRVDKKDRMFRGYVRASEISSPAPDGHFLRDFGQSDRSLIENANYKASTNQALSLMNGDFLKFLMNPNSVISQKMNSAEDSDELIDIIYLTTFSRYPSLYEKSLLRDEASLSGAKARQSILWSALNTQQFLFIQ